MGFTISAPGLRLEDVAEALKTGELSQELGDGDVFIQTSGEIIIGDENSGIIFHTGPGQTLEGEDVNKERWVEIYGQEVHFSQTSI